MQHDGRPESDGPRTVDLGSVRKNNRHGSVVHQQSYEKPRLRGAAADFSLQPADEADRKQCRSGNPAHDDRRWVVERRAEEQPDDDRRRDQQRNSRQDLTNRDQGEQ